MPRDENFTLEIDRFELLFLLPQMKLYRKKVPVKAIQIDHDFTLNVSQGAGVTGKVACKAGTWLAVNDKGNPYPIPDAQFKAMYEEL